MDWQYNPITRNWKRLIVNDKYIPEPSKLGEAIVIISSMGKISWTGESELKYLKCFYEKFYGKLSYDFIKEIETIKNNVDITIVKASKLMAFF